MFNLTEAQLAGVPALYSTEGIPLKDKLVYMHFTFPSGSDWYAMEHNGKDTFFGYVILNNDFQMSEAGYFYLSELADIKLHGYLKVECDPYWRIRPAGHVERICTARGWSMSTITDKLEVECPYCRKTILADSDSSDVWCSECKIIVLQNRMSSIP